MVQTNCVNKIIIICGATASGKTSLAIRLAKKLNTEIISADSMNVYCELNIGTAKPTLKERQEVKHHMIDVVTPFDAFSVGDYKEKAEPILQDLLKQGKIPIICGGTGFYINSLLYDLSYGKGKADLVLREYYNNLAKQYGNEYVFEILKTKDKLTAEKLHVNDLKRVIRALEICDSGVKKSELNDMLFPKYDYLAYSIDLESEVLYGRINTRVDEMIKNGLIDEVKKLKGMGVKKGNQCMQGIGYKEIYEYLENGQSGVGLSDTVEKIKLNTRHYAKRQKTFFKKLPKLNYLCPKSDEDLVCEIVEKL